MLLFYRCTTTTTGLRPGALLPARGPVDPSAGLLVRVAVHGAVAEGEEAGGVREGGVGHSLPGNTGRQLRDALHHQGRWGTVAAGCCTGGSARGGGGWVGVF